MHVAIPEGEGCPIEQLLTSSEPLVDAIKANNVIAVIFEVATIVVLEDFFDVLDGSDFFHGWFGFVL